MRFRINIKPNVIPAWLTVAICLLTLYACNEEKKYRIGVSQCSQDDWRMKMNDEIQREIMYHEDATVEIRSADDDSRKQIDDIRYFVDNGFDVIIVSPNEAATLTPVIKEVYDSGIPVIIFDRNIDGDSYTARIGADDEGLGRAAAHYALSVAGPAPNAIEIYGLKGSTPADGRHKGFSKEFTAKGGNILATTTANWKKEEAIPAVDSLLKTYSEVDVIFAHNDRMAIGASEAAKALGRDDIKIIGIDAAPEIGIKAVADSIIDATFLYPTEGHRVIRTALSILKGEPYERETIMPASSAVDVGNADILLRQNETLVDETDKIIILKKSIDDYWAQYATQKSLFYACIAIILLLFGVVFLVLRVYWQHKRHREVLLEQNHELESQRDQLAEQRDQLQDLNSKLEDATQSKLMFFTNVSHDLRTPLTLIAEPVAQLASATNLTASQQVLIKIADKNVRILQRLINQILDFRKYENGKLNLHLTEVDFRQTIKDWTESFVQLARKRDIKLRLESPEGDAPIDLAIDVEKMERVFFNLVSNAFKYTRDNGHITISYSISDARLTLRVADTGEGISERDLGNIFDRFYQVDRIHPKGSGIGLSLAKAFVELHGGSITVESELNKGSVFIVTLPVVHVADTSQAVDKQIGASAVEAELDNIEGDAEFGSDQPLVLVIDDNHDIREMVGELLSSDYNVITANNGSDGLKKAAKYVPDLVICDVMMPVMDGLECCRRLKQEPVTSHIPVLMLTACSMDEQRVQGYDNGADGYLSKPFSTDVLKSRSASLIRNRRIIKDLWQNPATKVLNDPGSKPQEKTMGKQPPSNAKPMPPKDAENEFYARFLKIFREEMGNPETTVDSLASRMGLERTQFYRKIKAITNYSPAELIRNLRLKKARALVTGSEKSISEIGYEVGFSTPAYFTKCYREAYGETPTETRQKLQ
ncbi:MAG: substrate-binding domain-containing protein [Muribaculaceae bacterium]|nr:substrate-binding domain-containing protein [Muribaculaceae bacterium]